MTAPTDLDEQTIVEVIKGFSSAYERRDLAAMTEFFADDADITAGPGTFRGKDAVRRFLAWDVSLSPRTTTRDLLGRLVVSGLVAVSERVISSTYEGIPYEYPIVTVYELNNDRKIEHMRAYYDKLALANQIASRTPGVKGWIESRILNYLVAQGEKGLPRS